MKSKQTKVCKIFILVLLTLQLSSAIPISKKRTSKQQSCQSWLASEVDHKIVPAQIADRYRLFALRDSTSLKELQDVGSLLKNGRVCNGLGDASNLQVVFESNQEMKSNQLQSEAILLVAPDSYQHDTAMVLKVSCDQQVIFLNITFTETIHTPRRLHVRAASHMTSEGSSHDSGGRVQAITGGAIVTVIGLLILISVVALCGGSNTYETSNNTAIDKRTDNEVAVSVTVSVTPIDQPTTNQVEATAKEQNGNASHPRPPTEPTEPKRQSLGSLSGDPTASAAASTEEQTARARTLSARSFDPLPELPKLDLAEKLSSADDKEDNEEEAPYSYARVPKGGDVPQSDSSDEDGNDSPNGEISPPAIPPYGKVTASDKGKQAPLDDMMGEYAEVTGEGRRDRSVTAPVDPSEVGRVRDNRAFTESAAHLPLPAIPKGPRPTLEEDNAMYDSIPETMAGAQARPAIIKKERLYESVDEMANDAEDMYESVSEELKPDSPVVVSPLILSPSSPELPPIPTSPRHPLDSPTTGPPTNQNLGLELKVDESSKKKKADKKALEKTLSTSDQAEKKRTFSIFNRKKAISVSEGIAKTKKKPEKELQSPKPHQGEPLPDIPPQLSPSLPLAHPKTPLPVPPNDDEEEDMYDKPEISLPKTSDSETTVANVRTTQDAKARSKTLPATGRSSGVNSFKFSQNLPLPELPENFGQGLVTVTHTRHLEDSSEVTEPYDIVHISPPPIDETEEPNYDTVRPDLILHVNPSLEVRGDPDPGYDRVGIKLDGAEESNALSDEDRGSERSTSPGGAGEIVVTEIPSPELDDSVAGPIPDHDEVGYARVPEMHLMRKRAMSANQGAMKKPNSEKKVSTDDTGVLKRATSPDEVYAIIDMAAKKRNRKKKSEDLGVTERDIENSSPVPPPLPPMGDLGDLSEFDQPPLPERLDEANHLIVEVENDSGYSKVLKVGPTLGADPPYAKVKSKVEHPYAELDIGGSAKPDLTNSSNPSSPIENEASSNDMITVPATKDNTDAADNDENHMYDTLSPPKSPTEVSVVIGTPEEEEDVSQNTYDTLTDTNAESRDVDLEEEGPYEEIDEETRQNLQKLHPKPV